MSKMSYANTVIYKLVHKDDINDESIYIGSTTDFIRRKNNHKDCCNNINKNGYTDKKYQYIRENGGWCEWRMLEVEKYPCNDSNEAREREEYWRSRFNTKLNSKKAFTTNEERLQQMKSYYSTHKERMNQQMKQRYLRVKAISNQTTSTVAPCV